MTQNLYQVRIYSKEDYKERQHIFIWAKDIEDARLSAAIDNEYNQERYVYQIDEVLTAAAWRERNIKSSIWVNLAEKER